jgi:malate/lactate dehydrogenase
MYRNGLYTCTEITAVIGSLPGTCYYMIAHAASRGINIIVSDNRRWITVIGCCCCSCVRRKYWILAVDCNIDRTCDHRWRYIMYRNSLDAGTEITAVIGSLPGPCYYMIARAASRGINIIVSDNRRWITVIRCCCRSCVRW